jgi:two-component system sensor kinase FixL
VPDSPSLLAELVHELNQPLTAILSNAQAAQRFLASGRVDLRELQEILGDIVIDDKRAAEIVRSIGAVLLRDASAAAGLDSATGSGENSDVRKERASE